MRAIASMLEERALAYIRLARKAGRFVSGYTQVKRALASEPLACLLIAEDAAVERRHEYQSLSENRQIPYRSFLTKARLGELAGRDESSAIGILDSGLSEHLMFYLEGMSRLAER
jgi:ribosomal protein L7Ae-like RNA K-turn-binding protein